MSAAPLETVALPEDLTRALRAAFGDEPVRDLATLTGGLSGATLHALNVGDHAYVLRRGDPTRARREIECMQIASDRGVAPTVRYADPDAGIVIMDRIAGGPLGTGPTRGAVRFERLARMLRTLHEGPAFPKGATIPGFIQMLDDTLRAQGAEALPGPLVAIVNELGVVLARFAETAPCHNDLNPNNILDAGDRLYFCDWETACAGDPYFDLAELGVFACPRAEERDALLEAYVDRAPTDDERARATVTRGMALGFYAAAFTFALAIQGKRASTEATPLPLVDLLALLSASRERAAPGVVSASLFGELQREVVSPAFEAAKRRIAAEVVG